MGFYDAQNKCLFGNVYGDRGGSSGYAYYKVIPREQWPDWAVEAHKHLED